MIYFINLITKLLQKHPRVFELNDFSTAFVFKYTPSPSSSQEETKEDRFLSQASLYAPYKGSSISPSYLIGLILGFHFVLVYMYTAMEE